MLAIFPLGIIIYVKSFREPKMLEANHRYTVGKVIKRSFPAEGGEMRDFDYYAKGKYYYGSFNINGFEERGPQIGERLYISFYPPDPSICGIMHDKLVPGTIGKAPPDGWDSLPPFIIWKWN